MRNKTTYILMVALATTVLAQAQDLRPSSSIYLNPTAKTDYVQLNYSVTDEGKRFEPVWGLDQAWINEQNLRKGMNHMGKENVGIGRSAFRTTKALTNDSVLSSDQINHMRQRSNIFNIVSSTLPIVFTADQEPGSDEYFVKNKSADVNHWAANINSHVHWMQANTSHPIVGISPFNEPDYWTVEEGATTAKQREVARLLKTSYPRCADIAMVGGNTLNDDKALDWYNSGKDYYDWGNTHQLAGSFDNFASFFQQVSADGKTGYADEMHNVVEAMVGLEYGMTVGIWWAFDSRTRGEFCDISRHGSRLAYGEHRSNWTAASVYRHDDGRVKAFIGSSERQAKTTNYQFLSTDRPVYYDGFGPYYEYQKQLPGGTGYQVGQTNAECVIDITWGEDVAPQAITDGNYKLVNKATGTVASVSGDNVVMQKYTELKTQQWHVYPTPARIGGDFSFYDIESLNNSQTRMNILNFSTSDQANVMAYSQNATPSSNEQWYLQYAGNGYYYLRNRETALYLTTASSYSMNGVNVYQRTLQTSNADRQLWRLLPLDVDYETEAPAQPSGLAATQLPAAVRLSWTAGSETDLDGYMVLRAESGSDDWNTIARKVHADFFVDNALQQGVAYDYRVKAIDRAGNLSEPSDAITSSATGLQSLVAHWTMEDNLDDETDHLMDAALYGTKVFMSNSKEGEKSLRLTRSVGNFIQLPYTIADSDELTVAMWVFWQNSDNWQRIFDFGNDTDHYMFLTPSNGSIMRFAIKDGGNEQTVDCSAKLTLNQWKHVAVSIGKDKTTIYVDGAEAASSTGITISPRDLRARLNYLGRSQFSADPLFNGYLDDVCVFNYALGADDVQQLMQGQLPTKIEAPSEEEAPVSYYDLSGRRLQQPRQGINVVEGRKIIVK